MKFLKSFLSTALLAFHALANVDATPNVATPTSFGGPLTYSGTVTSVSGRGYLGIFPGRANPGFLYFKIYDGTSGGDITSQLNAFNTYPNSGTLSVQAGPNPDPTTGAANPSFYPNGNGETVLVSSNFQLQLPYTSSAIRFTFITNGYTAQLGYRWAPNYVTPLYAVLANCAICYTFDPCAAAQSSPGFQNSLGSNPVTTCATFGRTYTFQGLNPGTSTNSFSIQTWCGLASDPLTVTSSYSFVVVVKPSPIIVGDPEIVGLQGQEFQVHGIPDEIFNMISSPSLQVNARFSYLEEADCMDNYTACFAHPGTYISEVGVKTHKHKVRVVAGTYAKGVSIFVDKKKVHGHGHTSTVASSTMDLDDCSLFFVNYRHVKILTPLVNLDIINSDKFVNQLIELHDRKLLDLGAHRVVLRDGERFHGEVPLHGLQGQTWKNVEYPSGLDYEGSILDYHVVSQDLFGDDFAFNQYKQ